LLHNFANGYLSMKIDFEFEKDGVVFRDAIHLPDDHGLSDAEIEAIKQARYANWLEAIKPAEEEPQE
jgi:hypothetical protein